MEESEDGEAEQVPMLGDERSIAEIDAKYKKRLINRLRYRFSKDLPEEDFEEAVNDSIQDLWKYQKGGKVIEKIFAFLKVVSQRRVVSKLRKTKTRKRDHKKEVGSEPLAAVQDSSVMPPDERFKIREQVDEALSLVSEQEKQLLQMRFLEGYSFEEIAQAMDLKANTARTKVQRALGKIKNKMVGSESSSS